MPFRVPRVQVVPQPDQQVSIQVEGQERLRWHFGSRSPRPFFFPIIGPAGRSLTRMGHPAAPDHDHHRSLWWGHRSVGGVNFWEERGGSQQIRQDEWVHYQDGDENAGMVVRLGWYDAHNVRIVQQELIAVYRPLANGEGWLELQSRFVPVQETLRLAQTNFGFIGLRMAASISAHYGGGQLTNSEGGAGEEASFGRSYRWMDYSGPIVNETWEGITWFDHPANPRYPTAWHVRDDGWMSPAFCLRDAYDLVRAQPLVLRYGLHIHARAVNPQAAEQQRQTFAESSALQVVAVKRPWRVQLRRAD